jgi:hypothetical protein
VSSDGIMVDKASPVSGSVYDGLGMYHILTNLMNNYPILKMQSYDQNLIYIKYDEYL